MSWLKLLLRATLSSVFVEMTGMSVMRLISSILARCLERVMLDAM